MTGTNDFSGEDGDGEDQQLYKPGDNIGWRYEVKRVLGRGGFGVVYLVYHRETGETCALKTFLDEFLPDAAAREAFKKEALVWIGLDWHPFVIAARWVDEFSGRLFVEMDYVAPDELGRVSLWDHLAHARGPIEPDKALEWAIQFCHGMEHANAHGIRCHRDIKPANILVAEGRTVRISDFGLASAAEASWRPKGGGGVSLVRSVQGRGPGLSILSTQDKSVCGTPGYMAPEVYRGDGADARSDIYSFGLVLWQMAAGGTSLPFRVRVSHDTQLEEYMAAVYEEQMSGLRPSTSSPMWPVIEGCLAADPSGRYPGFRELRADLEGILWRRTGGRVEVPQAGAGTAAYWNAKGASLAALGRHEEAVRHYDKALEIDPRCAPAWNNKGVSLQGVGRHEEAIHCLDKALQIDPRFMLAWNSKGKSLNDVRRYEEAIHCLDKALQIDARYAMTWNNKGVSLLGLGRHEEAIRCLDKALQIDPRDAMTWNSKGVSLQRLGRHEEAIHCLDKALQIDPRYAMAWNSKGVSLLTLGRHEEAICCCDKALETNPRYVLAWNNKGKSLNDLRRYEEALQCLDKALQIDPRFAMAWINKGCSLVNLRRYSEALRCSDKALEIDGRCGPAWYSRAFAAERLGDKCQHIVQ